MISNFPTKKPYNPGGLLSFKFIPADQVNYYPAIESGAVSAPLGLTAGMTWLNGYSTHETLNFREDCVDSDDTESYQPVITGFVPGTHAELINLMQSIEGRKIIVQISDTRKVTRLVGAFGFPVQLRAVYDSGTTRADANGFKFTISNPSIFRAPEYKP